MKNFVIILIGLCVMVHAAPQYGTQYNLPTDNEEDFTLTPSKLKFSTCKTPGPNIRDGICVDEGVCSENFTISVIIDDYDVRIGGCPGEKWCCVDPKMSSRTPEISTPPPPLAGCRTGLKDSCPWCAAVYRNNPRTKAPELICGGAVVGSRFVLTAASCAIPHRRCDLWVQLPGNTRQYPVNTTVMHKEFHSGTRDNDIALLLLNGDVEWPEGQKDDLGACLGLETPLEGNCVSIGFDDNDQLKFTPLTVSANNCSGRGSSDDAACGIATASGSCSVALGSPVVCPSGFGDLIMAGLVRRTCMTDSTIIGSLQASAEWVREELNKLGLAVDHYTTFN